MCAILWQCSHNRFGTTWTLRKHFTGNMVRATPELPPTPTFVLQSTLCLPSSLVLHSKIFIPRCSKSSLWFNILFPQTLVAISAGSWERLTMWYYSNNQALQRECMTRTQGGDITFVLSLPAVVIWRPVFWLMTFCSPEGISMSRGPLNLEQRPQQKNPDTWTDWIQTKRPFQHQVKQQ